LYFSENRNGLLPRTGQKGLGQEKSEGKGSDGTWWTVFASFFGTVIAFQSITYPFSLQLKKNRE
jgi:hypothetical protein